MTDSKKIDLFACVAAVLLSLLGLSVPGIGQHKQLHWFKGNLHTHTLNSDGDSLPAYVVKWYADNKYNFLFITDHEFITPIGPLNEKFEKPGEFVVMSAQEVTDSFEKKPQHVNGLGLTKVCKPAKSAISSTDNLQKNIDCIREGGGVPLINHPNFGWALTAKEIVATKSVMLLDIYNGHPLVNNLGGGGAPGTEAIWDAVLSSGRLIYGVGVDDSHYFKRLGDRSAPTPGQAWVMVHAEDLTQAAILNSLERGDFYASTGVELNEIKFDGRTLSLNILEAKGSRYTVEFIGHGGKILKTEIVNPAVYTIRGNEGYVRAKVTESNGRMAWTQPIFLKKK